MIEVNITVFGDMTQYGNRLTYFWLQCSTSSVAWLVLSHGIFVAVLVC